MNILHWQEDSLPLRHHWFLNTIYKALKNNCITKFPDGLLVRIPGFHCHGLGSVAGQGTEILKIAWHSQKMKKKNNTYAMCSVAQLCSILCDPMDWSTPGSSVHGNFQARILERVSISSSKGSFWPCVPSVSCTGRWILYPWVTQNIIRNKCNKKCPRPLHCKRVKHDWEKLRI